MCSPEETRAICPWRRVPPPDGHALRRHPLLSLGPAAELSGRPRLQDADPGFLPRPPPPPALPSRLSFMKQALAGLLPSRPHRPRVWPRSPAPQADLTVLPRRRPPFRPPSPDPSRGPCPPGPSRGTSGSTESTRNGTLPILPLPCSRHCRLPSRPEPRGRRCPHSVIEPPSCLLAGAVTSASRDASPSTQTVPVQVLCVLEALGTSPPGPLFPWLKSPRADPRLSDTETSDVPP